jgi:hypothetical protein
MKEYINDTTEKVKYEELIETLGFSEALIICYKHEDSIFQFCTDRVNFNLKETREFWGFKFYGVTDFNRNQGLNIGMNSISNIYSSKNYKDNLCLTDLSVKYKSENLLSVSINVNMAFGGIQFDFSRLELKMIEASAYFDEKSNDWIYYDINQTIDFFNPFNW